MTTPCNTGVGVCSFLLSQWNGIYGAISCLMMKTLVLLYVCGCVKVPDVMISDLANPACRGHSRS